MFNYQLNQLLYDLDQPAKGDVSFIESTNDANSVNPYNQIELYSGKSSGSSTKDEIYEEYVENSSFYLTAIPKENNWNQVGSKCTCM